jgi:glycosyltransferase involved in cell wall biosynthesis
LSRLAARDPVTIHPIPISRKIEPWKDFKSIVDLCLCFRRLRPEIVQLSTPKAALLGAIAARLARVPVRIYQIRGLSSESERGAKRWLFQRLETLTARLCTDSFVNAHSLLRYARQARIVRPREGHVAGQGMSNGVDLANFDPSNVGPVELRAWDSTWTNQAGPVVGFVGRLTRDKGLEELYAAWRVLREEFPKSRLLLVGPWEAENSVDPECSAGLRADPRVILAGMQHDIAPFYRAMDLFVFGSHGTEGFPNAPMEAAAMGLPVIATRVVGCVDAVVHDVTGKIITPQSSTEMEASIRTYLRDGALRREHGQAGQARIRSGFAPDDLWRDFHGYYVEKLTLHGLPLPVSTEEEITLPEAA